MGRSVGGGLGMAAGEPEMAPGGREGGGGGVGGDVRGLQDGEAPAGSSEHPG